MCEFLSNPGIEHRSTKSRAIQKSLAVQRCRKKVPNPINRLGDEGIDGPLYQKRVEQKGVVE